MDSDVLTEDYVPKHWTKPDPPGVCSCEQPQPEARAVRKGAARTYCRRCDLPIRLAFGNR
jgi:hypothetical protein